jgi:hypothetical protein
MKRSKKLLAKSTRYHLTNVIVHLADDWIVIGYCYPREHYKITKINEALHELKCPARLLLSGGKIVLMLKRDSVFDNGVPFEPGVMISPDGRIANFDCCNTNLSLLTLFER